MEEVIMEENLKIRPSRPFVMNVVFQIIFLVQGT